MFKKVKTNLSFVENEHEVEKYWKENQINELCLKMNIENKKNNSYVFYDGPPTANGKPHIGHVETRAFKDLIPRFHAMRGAYVPRKAGWDTHGLPVELEVEKQLGINGKDQIESYGNTRECGKTFHIRLHLMLIWIIHMLLITMTI